jgi:uncharacterized protein (UPF0332 family)
MTWTQIGKKNLHAAKQLANLHPRSSSSRAYYAAHAVLADALAKAGYLPGRGRQTPPHDQQRSLISSHLATKGQRVVRELRAVIWRLYAYRLDADYRRTVAVDRARALESVRDACTLFRLLGVGVTL